MGASGGTTIFFSPSLYFTVSVRPSTPATVCSTLALVIVLCGRRSHGRCPSPVPRIASGKICTSTAFWLPSACGIPVTPTNEPGLMSEIDALVMPTTAALSDSATLTSEPSRDLTTNVWPSTSWFPAPMPPKLQKRAQNRPPRRHVGSSYACHPLEICHQLIRHETRV